MLMGLLFAGGHLLLLLWKGEAVAQPAGLQGLAANFLFGWMLGWLASRMPLWVLSRLLLVAGAIVLSLGHSHVLINGSLPSVAHLDQALNRTFVASMIADASIAGRAIVYAALALVAQSLVERTRPDRDLAGANYALVLLAAVGYVLASDCLRCGPGDWRAHAVVDYNVLTLLQRSENELRSIRDGRLLVPPEAGEQLVEQEGANVILLFVEGLDRELIASGVTPRLASFTTRGLSVARFITHQRQTNRGLYAALCGAYPNLREAVVKSDLMALSGLEQTCLPKILADNGYRTVFLQSANLEYMSKGRFAEAAGFTEWHGEEHFEDPSFVSSWGVDDRTLYEGALAMIERLDDSPYFLALLTSGTHPPYETPSSSGHRLAAFKYADDAFGWFLAELERRNHLDATVLIVTSDEASSVPRDGGERYVSGHDGVLAAYGAGVGKSVNPGLFGQVDVATSVLDFVGIDADVFGGRSVFEAHPSGRMIFAGNTYSRRLFAFSDRHDLSCSYRYECEAAGDDLATESGIAQDVARQLQELVARNDIVSVTGSDYLASLPERSYAGSDVHQLLGRLVTAVPVGGTLILEAEIDNADPSARDLGLEWLAFECSGKEETMLGGFWFARKGMRARRIRGRVPQLYPQQCHKVWVGAIDGEPTAPWTLTSLVLTEGDHQPLPAGPRTVPRVAHAGGAFGGATYTNSFEALDANYEKGFRTFEVDFSWTADGHLVCLHDWEQSFEANFGARITRRPTLAEYREILRVRGKFTSCTFADLVPWLAAHPDAVVVTDVKENNDFALASMADLGPAVRRQLIPQVHDPTELLKARTIGFERIIWTLYRFGGSDREVMEAAWRHKPYAVTMPSARADRGLGGDLARIDIRSYVHTINDETRARDYLTRLGVSEIYTDHIDPRWAP